MAPSGPASPMIGATMRSRRPSPDGERVGQLVVLELGRHVVADGDDPALGHGLARDALAEPQVGQLDALALGVADARVVGPAQGLAVRVELVDDRAVGAQQADRLVGDALQDVAGLAHRGQPGTDLAQRLLGLRAALDVASAIGRAGPSGWRCVIAIDACVASAATVSTSSSE